MGSSRRVSADLSSGQSAHQATCQNSDLRHNLLGGEISALLKFMMVLTRNLVVPSFHTRCNRNSIRQNTASSLMSSQSAEQFWRVCQQISALPSVHKLIARWEFSNIQVCRVPKGTTVSSCTFTSTELNLMVLPGFMARNRFFFAKERSYFGFMFNYSLC